MCGCLGSFPTSAVDLILSSSSVGMEVIALVCQGDVHSCSFMAMRIYSMLNNRTDPFSWTQ